MRPTIPLVLLLLLASCRSGSPPEESTEQREPPRVAPTTPPAPEPTLGGSSGKTTVAETRTIRAGARRLEAFRTERYRVRFAPDASLKLEKVDRALGQDRLSAVVGPFAEKKRGGAANDVADAGEIVALALARQLETLGWSALVAAGAAAGNDQVSGGQDGEDPRGRPRLTRFFFAGEVSFWAEHTAAAVTATLEGTVTVRDSVGAVVRRSQVKAQGKVGRAAERSTVRRVERAEEAALAGFVRRLLTDPRLGDGLVKAIKAARAARR